MTSFLILFLSMNEMVQFCRKQSLIVWNQLDKVEGLVMINKVHVLSLYVIILIGSTSNNCLVLNLNSNYC